MVNFVPTFEPVEPQEVTLSNDTPDEVSLSQGKDFCFIFIVDRSGSMRGNRMHIAKQALELFI